MGMTRSAIEAQLLRRCGRLMAKASLDAITSDGTNASLDDPIRRAAVVLGLAVKDPVRVTDDDLIDLDGIRAELLLDHAELRTLESIWGNWDEVDQQVGQNSQKFSQLADRLQKRIDAAQSRIAAQAAPETLKESRKASGSTFIGPITAGSVIPNDPFAPGLGPSRPGGWPYR